MAQNQAALGRKLLLDGVQKLKSGQAEAALPVLVEAINQGAAAFDGYHALGVALLRTGRLAEACPILQQAVSLRPHAAPAQIDLAAAFEQTGQIEGAIICLQRAAEINPRQPEVWLRLGQLLAQVSRMPEAAAALERAAGLRPDTVEALLQRSDAALLREDFAGAEAWARKAVARAAGLAATHAALAGILYNQGKFEQAAACFGRALELEPAHPKAWEGLVRCQRFEAAGSAAQMRLEAVLRRADLAPEVRMGLHFALGKIYDDISDYGAAMAQFEAGNRLRARLAPFDRAALQGLVERAIAAFPAGGVAAQGAAASELPVFIVGMYRSGTTLVERILSSHAQVAAGGELTIWGLGEMEPEPSGRVDGAALAVSAAKYLAGIERIGQGKLRVTDKLPPNFLRLGAIHAALPGARIIHITRNPLDTCLSLYTTLFASPLGFAAKSEDLVFYYRLYQRIMAHWRSVLPASHFLEISYEALVAEPEAAARRMVAFLGLEWDAACLRPEANPRGIGTASAWQARQKIHTGSTARWEKYRPWLGALLALQATVSAP